MCEICLSAIGVSRWIVCLTLGSFMLSSYAEAAAKLTKADKVKAGDELFSGKEIPRIQIEVPAKAMERLRGRGWSWGWGGWSGDRPEVQVTVLEGGRIYTNVALHLKGAAGSFQPVESKPAL